jgi:hypothetical protein
MTTAESRARAYAWGQVSKQERFGSTERGSVPILPELTKSGPAEPVRSLRFGPSPNVPPKVLQIMSRSHGTPAIPAALRPQLQIAAALARERLAEVHFRYAAELVDHACPDIDPSRVLAIYVRLHGLRGADATRLYHSVFVSLGRRQAPKPLVDGAPAEGAGWKTPQSVLGQIRNRLRGRVNTELREWVEYHTGRAETELLGAHVDNALQFVQLLEPRLGIAEAVAVYAEELAVQPRITETIYYLALARRSPASSKAAPGQPSRGDLPSRAFPEQNQRVMSVLANRRAPGAREVG